MSLFSSNDLKTMGVVKTDGSYKVAPKKKPVQEVLEFFEFKSEVPEGAIFIPGDVMSSKNSRLNFIRKTRYPGGPQLPPTEWTVMSLMSKAAQEYCKESKTSWALYRNDFLKMIAGLKKPYHICFYFVFSTNRKWDYCNMAQLPLDLMQEHKWIENDDSRTVIPVFKGFEVNKQKPGLYIFYEKPNDKETKTC
jgi:hypothetical protein